MTKAEAKALVEAQKTMEQKALDAQVWVAAAVVEAQARATVEAAKAPAMRVEATAWGEADTGEVMAARGSEETAKATKAARECLRSRRLHSIATSRSMGTTDRTESSRLGS